MKSVTPQDANAAALGDVLTLSALRARDAVEREAAVAILQRAAASPHLSQAQEVLLGKTIDPACVMLSPLTDPIDAPPERLGGSRTRGLWLDHSTHGSPASRSVCAWDRQPALRSTVLELPLREPEPGSLGGIPSVGTLAATDEHDPGS
jgi:hypothetical protein